MKTTIKFRNEEGQFCSENCNHGFEVEREFCKITAKRAGQADADEGNYIVVSLLVRKTGIPINFKSRLFGIELHQTWSCGEKWQYRMSDSNLTKEYKFSAPTWREAFLKAKTFTFEELEKYDVLVKAREQALIDAEF